MTESQKRSYTLLTKMYARKCSINEVEMKGPFKEEGPGGETGIYFGSYEQNRKSGYGRMVY